MSFAGKNVVVTGAASGIGRALAGELVRRGAVVVLADRDGPDAEQVAAQLRAGGGRASARQVDVAVQAQVAHLVEETMREHGRIDYLFNNAGIGAGGEVYQYSVEMWDRLIAVNVNGVAYGVHAAYPLMIRQGFGHIVNTASSAGLVCSPGLVSYSATKHAVVGLSKGLLLEARAHNVRVSVLCPGVIRTAILTGGRHGVFAAHAPEAQQRKAFSALFEKLRPMDVDAFARRTLDHVARNHFVIIVPGVFRLGWWLERWCPWLWMWVTRRLFEANRGVLSGKAG